MQGARVEAPVSAEDCAGVGGRDRRGRVPPASPTLPFLLALLRFVTRRYFSSPPSSSSTLSSVSHPQSAVVTINLPVPSPGIIDLGE